jgi:c-di-GMP-binding flagellar brake protein YcgR
MGTERRQFIRLDARLNVSYTIAGTKQLGTSLSRDVSGGGVRFVAEHSLDVGARLEVIVHLPTPDTAIRFVGEVMWTKLVTKADAAGFGGTEVGVRFVEITSKDATLIKQYAAFYAPPPA